MTYTPLQQDILTVLRINPTPLMTAADIASVINQWPGKRRNSLGIGACAYSIEAVKSKPLWSGRWAGYRPGPYRSGTMRLQFGYWVTKATYWYLASRAEEAHISRDFRDVDVSKLLFHTGGGGGDAFEPSSDDRRFLADIGDGE